MHTRINAYIHSQWIALAVFGLMAGSVALAANDPSIKGSIRKQVKTSMEHHIQDHAVGDTYYLFDAVDGRLLRLTLKKLHAGIVKKGGMYVSCADFVDQSGRLVDVDFLVIQDGEAYKTTQGVVHAIDGDKRKYHLEG